MIFLAPFFWGVPWLPTSLARSSRLIGSVGKGGSCAGLLCGSLATRLRIPPVSSGGSSVASGVKFLFSTKHGRAGWYAFPLQHSSWDATWAKFCWSPSPHFKYHSALWEKTCRHYFLTDLDDSHLSPAWCLKMEYFFMQEFVKMIRCEDVKM